MNECVNKVNCFQRPVTNHVYRLMEGKMNTKTAVALQLMVTGPQNLMVTGRYILFFEEKNNKTVYLI